MYEQLGLKEEALNHYRELHHACNLYSSSSSFSSSPFSSSSSSFVSSKYNIVPLYLPTSFPLIHTYRESTTTTTRTTSAAARERRKGKENNWGRVVQLLDFPVSELRWLYQTQHIGLLELQQYLFAREASLLLSLRRYKDLLESAYSFIVLHFHPRIEIQIKFDEIFFR